MLKCVTIVAIKLIWVIYDEIVISYFTLEISNFGCRFLELSDYLLVVRNFIETKFRCLVLVLLPVDFINRKFFGLPVCF